MGRIILVIGGAGSGKSEYAERLCEKLSDGNKKFYLATMKNDGSKAYEERVKRHRKLREGKGFFTLEKERNLSELSFHGNETVLLEDLTNLLSNFLFSDAKKPCSSTGVLEDVLAVSYKVKNIVIVMNDVFRDGICYDDSTEIFLEELGIVHRMLADKADKVVKVIYGIPVILKES